MPQAATYDILERSGQILGNGTVGQQYDQHMDPIKSYTTPNWEVVEVGAVQPGRGACTCTRAAVQPQRYMATPWRTPRPHMLRLSLHFGWKLLTTCLSGLPANPHPQNASVSNNPDFAALNQVCNTTFLSAHFEWQNPGGCGAVSHVYGSDGSHTVLLDGAGSTPHLRRQQH